MKPLFILLIQSTSFQHFSCIISSALSSSVSRSEKDRESAKEKDSLNMTPSSLRKSSADSSTQSRRTGTITEILFILYTENMFI